MSDLQTAMTGFTGTVLRPGEEGYDDARAVFNGLIDRRPALIARCTSAADVAAAVRFGRAEGLTISVYGGGHSVTGAAVSDDGLCIDLRGLKDVSVDPATRTARVGGGVTWGELDAATQEHGLAVTGGRVPTTGVGGLALGSGSGWLERAFGFTCDNLIEAEVATAAGEIVTASATENPDLFWAIRGGGGNFGIVTSFEFQLHPVGPEVLSGLVIHPLESAREVLRFYRDFLPTTPEQFACWFVLRLAPPLPVLAPVWHV
jgi:FAD/FMN-containing dehydrogenase